MTTRRGSKREPATPSMPKALRLSDVEDRASSYLIEPYLPLGAITLLEGDPGSGKSFVAADLAAAVTRGKVPDLGLGPVEQPRRDARSVLVLTAEDSPGALRQRFKAQGADLERVLVVPEPVSCRDLSPLVALLEQHEPGLLVVDPIHGLLDGVNLNAANSVRCALAPLITLAVRFDLAVLGVRHLAKAGRGRAVYRGLGSIDFAAVSRSLLRAGEDPQRPGSRVLVHVKHSHGPLGPSVEFEIGERLVWLGKTELSSRDLEAAPASARGRSALELAEDFLREHLASGAKTATETEAAAAAAGVSQRSLERAAASLGVSHLRMNEGGRGKGHWVWRLASDAKRAGGLEADS